MDEIIYIDKDVLYKMLGNAFDKGKSSYFDMKELVIDEEMEEVEEKKPEIEENKAVEYPLSPIHDNELRETDSDGFYITTSSTSDRVFITQNTTTNNITFSPEYYYNSAYVT